MEVEEVEKLLGAFESSLSGIKWKLKPSSKRRLETDILALITEMRPVIMIDYGGKMPELQERLCSFLKHCKEDSSLFEPLKVMVMEDMIFLVHAKALATFVKSSLCLETGMLFIDLEQDPPKMITQCEKNSAAMQLLSIQEKFSSLFSSDDLSQCTENQPGPSAGVPSTLASSEVIDLSNWIEETGVTVPSLNGWLLGYPVVYLFSKEHIQHAIYNLSTKSLHLFQVFISSSRNVASSRGSKQEELMSFSVPYDLSLEGRNEPWVTEFLDRMWIKLESCKQVWGALRMEVSGCYPQSIVL